MTDEQRQKLCEDLLLMADAHHYGPLYKRAADEIERLAKRVEELETRVELMKVDAMGDDA
jgi:hypothetical protein